MIGICIAAKKEWEATIDYFKIRIEDCKHYPFGEYFNYVIDDKNIIFFRCGVRKVNCSAAVQYMIDKFDLDRIIVCGTCCGIDDKYKNFDVIIPNFCVQYDCTVKETEPLIKDSFNVTIDLSKYDFDFNTGVVGTADKPVVMWKDYLELKDNNITIADTESAAIAYVCKLNGVECIIIMGISDFPTNEEESDLIISYEEQYVMFVNNIPIIMNKIFDNYLFKFI